ncbi:unnamed protein product [Closterium sp. NIES-65]|nr:unnamed protein product [Closterium sp. NIES-65]
MKVRPRITPYNVGGIKGNDQYIYRHANGLIVVGLAPSHAALAADRVISAVDFHVGKRSRLEMEATGKNKQRATPLDANSALCKIVMVTPPPDTVTATDTGTISGGDANAATTVPNVTESNPTAVSCTTNAAPGSSAAGSGSTISVCCVKGRLIEVNRQLATNPILLRDKAASEGYIAVLLPHPAEWAAAQPRLLTEEQYESADI